MKVYVAGGTGFIGTALCTELADRGHEVVAMSRSPADAALPEGVERVRGDVSSPESFGAKLADTDVLVNLVALSPLRIPKGGEGKHDRVHRRGTKYLVRKAEKHDVDRFVQLSALSADPNAPTRYLRAKGQAENAVRDGELDWTIFRPSVVFGDGGEFVSFTRTLTPPVLAPLPGGGRTRFQPVWVGDLAPMIADAATAETDTHVGETYEIGGPEVLTLAAVAKMSRRARGQSTRVVSVPMGLAKVGLQVLGAVPGFPFGRDQFRSLRLDNVTEDNDIDAFGLEPDDLTTLAAYLGVDRPRDAGAAPAGA